MGSIYFFTEFHQLKPHQLESIETREKWPMLDAIQKDQACQVVTMPASKPPLTSLTIVKQSFWSCIKQMQANKNCMKPIITRQLTVVLCTLLSLLISNTGLGDESPIALSSQAMGTRAAVALEPIKPIPLSIDVDPQKVELGKRLFEDKRLSKDGSMACRNCHYMDKGGTDGEQFSPTINGGYRSRNTPTIFNLGLYKLYGWYGMPTNLEDLSEAIIKSKKGLASDWPEIIPMLNQDSDYVRQFSAIYPDAIQPENVKNAIAEYLRSLITPNSRFDDYLRGNKNALNQQEKEGYRLFKAYGCTSCHQGVAVGANMVAPFNIFRNYLDQEKTLTQLEAGRFNKTKDEKDRYVFRVPSLRNVELTAPYLHDGSATSLEGTIDLMGRYMLGRIIPIEERKSIAKFLKTLTGQHQEKPL